MPVKRTAPTNATFVVTETKEITISHAVLDLMRSNVPAPSKYQLLRQLLGLSMKTIKELMVASNNGWTLPEGGYSNSPGKDE